MSLPIHTDILDRPIVFDGPAESGGAVLSLVSAVVTDLPYEDGSIERVTPEALTADLEEWVGRPVVFGDAKAHDPTALAQDPHIQGEQAIGTVIEARYDADRGERTMRIAVPRRADAEKARRTHYTVSEAYRSQTRPPTADERAQGVTAVQVRRHPLSLALIDARRGGRAGPRARVRTDGAMMPDPAAPGSLDALMAFLADYKDSAEAKMLVQAWLGTPMIEAIPEADMQSMDQVKAERDAAIMRADAAEARLLKLDAAEVAADLKRAGIVCDGFDPGAPTVESVRKATAARDAAALAALRTDRAPTPYVQPTPPGEGGATTTVRHLLF